ncbi:MAG: hypothetical protein ACU0CO_10195 [Shimia sp.]
MTSLTPFEPPFEPASSDITTPAERFELHRLHMTRMVALSAALEGETDRDMAHRLLARWDNAADAVARSWADLELAGDLDRIELLLPGVI